MFFHSEHTSVTASWSYSPFDDATECASCSTVNFSGITVVCHMQKLMSAVRCTVFFWTWCEWNAVYLRHSTTFQNTLSVCSTRQFCLY